jgi:hypothetical protein
MAKHDLRCMQFVDSGCTVIQRVIDYLLQQHQKLFGVLLANCQRVKEHRMQDTFIFPVFIWILQAVDDTLLHSAKTN